jgi:hypothetical protein
VGRKMKEGKKRIKKTKMEHLPQGAHLLRAWRE